MYYDITPYLGENGTVTITEEEKKSIVTTYQTQKETRPFATRPTQNIYGASFSSNNDEMAD